jgi:hypothetical protein
MQLQGIAGSSVWPDSVVATVVLSRDILQFSLSLTE